MARPDRASANDRLARSKPADTSAASPARAAPARERRSGSRPTCAAGRVSSICALKRARRSAQNTASIRLAIQPTRGSAGSDQRYRISAGATPNEIASDSESSSAPNRLSPCSMPRDPAVEAVEHARDHDHRHRALPLAADREAHAGQAGAQRERGDRVGRDRAQRQPARAAGQTRVAAPAARSIGRVGRHRRAGRSLRDTADGGAADPADDGLARDRCAGRAPPAARRRRAGTRRRGCRSGSARRAGPAATMSPGLTKPTMRRATRPAIWVKPICAPSRALDDEMLALVLVATPCRDRR